MRNIEELKSMTQEDLVRLTQELEETVEKLREKLESEKSNYDIIAERYCKLRNILQNLLDLSYWNGKGK